MSDFQTSPLIHSVNEITSQNKALPHWSWSLKFKLLPESGFDFTNEDLARNKTEQDGFFSPIALTNLDFIADYEKGFCDHINCSLQIPSGMWMKVLAPYREHLRVYLTRETKLFQGGGTNMEEDPLIIVCKPIFKDNAEAYETVSTTLKISRTELDIRSILTVDVDLLDPVTESIQTAACGGIWRDALASDVLQSVFSEVCSQMMFEGERLIAGQIIADKTNTEKRKHITVTSGTPLVDLPMLLQKEFGGIWPTGCSRFIHKGQWYFYPPYDITRVLREKTTLTIIRIPETIGMGAKHTFLLDDTQLKILASSESQIRDMTQSNFLLQGDGVRFSKASSVMDDWLTVKDNKAVAKRSTTNTEARVKADGQTDHRTFNSPKRFTDNTFEQYSALASRTGQLLSFAWNYADHTLIRPGMACKVLYEKDDEIKELSGVVVGRHATIQTTQSGASLGNHLTTCALFVFCNELDENA